MQISRDRLYSHYQLPLFALAMLAGNVLFQLQPSIDAHTQGPIWTTAELLGILPLCLLLPFLTRRYQWLAVLLVGYLWALLFAQLHYQYHLEHNLEGQTILIEGVVTGLPDITSRSQRFDFLVDRVHSPHLVEGTGPRRIRLSWYYYPEPVHTAQRWQLDVRLKQPHGMQNPGGFDYEKWLYSHGFNATGYVRKSEQNRLLETAGWSVGGLRQQLSHTIQQLEGSPFSGIIRALAIGDKSGIDSQQWQTLVSSGTSHLMAISGLHIGLVAGLAFWLGYQLFSWIPRLSTRKTIQQQAAVLSLSIALFYAVLAGFSIPTQRAFIMLLVMLGATLLRRPAFGLNTLALAMIVVLMIDPRSSLQAGFWLSFLAVLIISLLVQGRPVMMSGGKFSRLEQGRQLVGVQVWIALGMLPITIILFQQGSLVSPLANMLMIPLVGFIVVPLVLIASAISLIWPEFIWLFELVSHLLAVAWWLLELLLQVPAASHFFHASSLATSVLALAGTLLLLLPIGLGLRIPGAILLLPLLVSPASRPSPGELWLSVLDVGQGLSLLLQTHTRSLLFDAGDRPSERFDIGERVVVPFLRHRGVSELDILMISHGDRDHRGGAVSVMQSLPVAKVMGFEFTSGLVHQPCRAGQRWYWDAVLFEVLHPDRIYAKSNNQSCVLRVSGPGYSLLIPGDIERKIEKQLVSHTLSGLGEPDQGVTLKSDVLVLAHHGSNTSTSREWLEQVRPEVVIASAGYRNRFGHPADRVRARVAKQGAQLFNTAETGGISIRFGQQAASGVLDITSARKVRRHYWNHRVR